MSQITVLIRNPNTTTQNSWERTLNLRVVVAFLRGCRELCEGPFGGAVRVECRECGTSGSPYYAGRSQTPWYIYSTTHDMYLVPIGETTPGWVRNVVLGTYSQLNLRSAFRYRKGIASFIHSGGVNATRPGPIISPPRISPTSLPQTRTLTGGWIISNNADLSIFSLPIGVNIHTIMSDIPELV